MIDGNYDAIKGKVGNRMGPIPKEIEDLFAIFEPYVVEGHLENAPQEAIDAYEKALEWSFEQGQ